MLYTTIYYIANHVYRKHIPYSIYFGKHQVNFYQPLNTGNALHNVLHLTGDLGCLLARQQSDVQPLLFAL